MEFIGASPAIRNAIGHVTHGHIGRYRLQYSVRVMAIYTRISEWRRTNYPTFRKDSQPRIRADRPTLRWRVSGHVRTSLFCT